MKIDDYLLHKVQNFYDKHLNCQDERKIYRIKWNGHYIQCSSGKTVWASKGAAKNAFHHTIDYGLKYEIEQIIGIYPSSNDIKQIMDYFISKGLLEFVEIVE